MKYEAQKCRAYILKPKDASAQFKSKRGRSEISLLDPIW